MSSAFNPSPLRTDPLRAFTFLFLSPNWPNNLLWLTLATLLQQFVVGSIFTLGYGSELIRNRAGHPQGRVPDIDSSRLGDYFMRGLWPFLAYLVASIALVVVMLVLVACMALVLVIVAILEEQAGWAEIAGPLKATLLLYLSAAIVIWTLNLTMYIVPVLIRGMITQDFALSFDWSWSRGFVRIMFWEIILSGIVFYLLSLLVIVIGFAILCVGVIPASGLISGAMMHLLSQWYEVYLSRGGEPVAEPSSEVLAAQIID